MNWREIQESRWRTVTHVQDALDLSAEICVTRRINDVDLDALHAIYNTRVSI